MVSSTSPVIFLVGDEEYLKEKALSQLRSSLLDKSSGELDYKVLHAPDTSANEILNCVSTIPFFSSKRLVVVKDFERLPKEDRAKIISYVKNPNQYTCLVVDMKDGDILEEDPELMSCAKILRFTDLSDTELSSWISEYVSSRGKNIEEGALEILQELQGKNLLNLSQELEKLITFVGSRSNISSDDVEAVVGKSVLASAFDITDALSEKDISRAVAIVSDLMTAGKKPYEIIGLLSWHFKRILKAKALISRGMSEFSIGQNLRIPRKNAREFFTQVQALSSERLEEKMKTLLETDMAIKRPKYKPSLVMEMAIIRLCLEGGGEPLREARRLS